MKIPFLNYALRLEKRSQLANPPQWLIEFFGGGAFSQEAGVTVNTNSAMTVSAFFAGIRVLSEDISSLPWNTLRRLKGRGKEKARSHPVFGLLHDRPNDEMTSCTWRSLMMANALLHGNGYSEIELNGAGRPAALWPLKSELTIPRRIKGSLWYETDSKLKGKRVLIPAQNIFHLRGLGTDELEGISIVENARRSLGIMIASEKYGAAFFGNNAKPSAILIHPKRLGDEGKKSLTDSFNLENRGPDRSGKVIALEEGIKYVPIGLPPGDAQFLETRKFGITDCARWLRIPPHKIGDLEKATFSNIEELSISYVMDGLLPWAVKLEQEANFKLFQRSERKNFSTQIVLDGLLRGNFESRTKGLAVGRQWGWLSINDVRELENMNPIGDQGDTYMVPLNMISAETLVEGNIPTATLTRSIKIGPDGKFYLELPRKALPPGRGVNQAIEIRSGLLATRIQSAHVNLFQNAEERILRKECTAVRRAAKKLEESGDWKEKKAGFIQKIDEFYETHDAFVSRSLVPVVVAFANSLQAVSSPALEETEMTPEFERFCHDFAADLGVKHTLESLKQTREAIHAEDSTPEQIIQGIKEFVDGWETDRPARAAAEYCQKAMSEILEFISSHPSGAEPGESNESKQLSAQHA